MIKAWTTYILTLSLLLIFKYFYIDYMPFIFIAIAICLPIISMIYVIIGLYSIKVNMICSPNICNRNGVSDLNIMVINKSFLSFPLVKIKFSIPEKLGKPKKSKILDINIASKKCYEAQHKIICSHRGIYEGNIYYIEVYDLLGLFRLKLRYKNIIKLKVVPNRIIIPKDGDVSYYNSDNGKNIGKLSINNISLSHNDINGTRKYIIGDELKSIHWKHSAKLDEIMVKEFEEENESFILVAMDLKSYNKKSQYEIDFTSDGIIETSIAILLKCIIDSIPVDVIWYDIISKQVNSEKLLSIVEFEKFFNNIVEADLYNDNIFIDEMIFNHMDYNKNYNSIFFITSNISSDLVSKLCILASNGNIQINAVYFEVSYSDEIENNFNLMKYYGIKIFYIKHGEILNAFSNNT